MDTQTLATESTRLEACPVWLINEDGEPEPCGGLLRATLTRSVVGDDYGSWPTYSVSFPCGHTFEDMSTSLRHADEV